MNKISNNYFFLFFVSIVVGITIVVGCVRFAHAADAGKNLYLKNISVSKKADSYFIWFEFNGKPGSFIPKYSLNNNSLKLSFSNTYIMTDSKFIKFNNKLFGGIELTSLKNLHLNAIVFFNKGVKINKKDIRGSFYGNYFIISIAHKFIGVVSKNTVKKSAVLGLSKGSRTFTANPISKNKDNFNAGFEVGKTVLYLLLILGLIYAIYFLLLKFKGKVAIKKGLNNLKIVSSLNLGNKKSILLIEVNGELFLVGVYNTGIQVIGHIEDLKSKSLDIGDNKNYDSEKPTFGGRSGNESVEPYVSARKADIDSGVMSGLGQKLSGGFAKVLKNRINSKERTDADAGTQSDFNKQSMENGYKIKNISESRFKNKADNVFFDIEERLKGLMENDGNIKKF